MQHNLGTYGEWLLDSGSVPRRQPWALGYRIKFAVTIRFSSIKLPPIQLWLNFWMFIAQHRQLCRMLTSERGYLLSWCWVWKLPNWDHKWIYIVWIYSVLCNYGPISLLVILPCISQPSTCWEKSQYNIWASRVSAKSRPCLDGWGGYSPKRKAQIAIGQSVGYPTRKSTLHSERGKKKLTGTGSGYFSFKLPHFEKPIWSP